MRSAKKYVSPRVLAVFMAWLAILVHGPTTAMFAQTKAEHFWLAGRYDGDRVIVYFDKVHFNGTVPPTAKEIAAPVAPSFSTPIELPADYVAQFLKAPGMEHFAVGNKYDLLLEDGAIATVTLTTLVGFEGDEGVGNYSMVGALATIDDPKTMSIFFSKDLYVLRRHRETPAPNADPPIKPVYAGIQDEPVQFDIQKQILDLLTERMESMATQSERQQAERIPPELSVQAFGLADGTLRYYARGAWSSGQAGTDSFKTVYALGAWITPSPALRIVAVQERTSPYAGIGNVLPALLNVVDLGGGRTGIITETNGEDSNSLDLKLYRDGSSLRDMQFLQSIGQGE